jgi:hypothetical protein
MRNTPVTTAVLALWVVTFLCMQIRGLGDLNPVAWLSFNPGNPVGSILGIFTHGFVAPGDLIGLALGGLVFYQFGGSLERAWLPRTFLLFLLLTNAATVVVWEIGRLVFGGLTPVAWPWVMVSTVIVAFCWLNPQVQINIMFLIPIQARWLGWITIALTALFTVPIGLASIFTLGGIGAAVAYIHYRDRWGWVVNRRRQTRGPARGVGRPPLQHPASQPLAWLKRPYTEWQRKRRVAQLEKTFRLDD